MSECNNIKIIINKSANKKVKKNLNYKVKKNCVLFLFLMPDTNNHIYVVAAVRLNVQFLINLLINSILETNKKKTITEKFQN